MAVVNMNNLLNGKDSRWLQLEVCREYQRNKCSRPDTDCKFAHPAANVEVQNGRVTACYDSIKVLERARMCVWLFIIIIIIFREREISQFSISDALMSLEIICTHTYNIVSRHVFNMHNG